MINKYYLDLYNDDKQDHLARWRSSAVLYNFLELYHLSEAMSIYEAMMFYEAMPFYEAISALLPAV